MQIERNHLENSENSRREIEKQVNYQENQLEDSLKSTGKVLLASDQKDDNSLKNIPLLPELSQKILSSKYNTQMQSLCSPLLNILEDPKSPEYHRYTELLGLEEPEEMLSRRYLPRELLPKLRELTRFYKFHLEVPRLFMTGKYLVIHQFYDQKRRDNYDRVRRMLQAEQVPEDTDDNRKYSLKPDRGN